MPEQSAPPPSADPKRAEKYISQFVSFVNNDKLKVIHTDLSKYDPSSLEDHYRIELEDYSVEVSHSKQPNTGADSYVMLFTNIKNITENGSCEKIILAYLHLDVNQFIRFKAASDDQVDRIKKAEEERRFNQAIAPIDQVLDKLDNNQGNTSHHSQSDHQIPNNHFSTPHNPLSDFEFPESLNKPSF